MKIKLELSQLGGGSAQFGTGFALAVYMSVAEWKKLGKPTMVEVEINVP